jgi:hypothetical protein
MARELREVWRITFAGGDTDFQETAPDLDALRRLFSGAEVERLTLLTPEAAAVIEAAVALVTDDPSDPWGYQKDVQFDTLRGEVVHYIATRGADAN